MKKSNPTNEDDLLIGRLGLLYERIVRDGLPDTIDKLLMHPESEEIRHIGKKLIAIHGLDIMLEIGRRLYPRDDEMAFTCNLLLSVIFELPFDFSKGYWVLGSDHSEIEKIA